MLCNNSESAAYTEFPPIFKRTTNGAIQQWQITVRGNTYFVTEGLVGGKLTISLPTLCHGKNVGKMNETNPIQQAYKEAGSLITRKLESGYRKSINDIDSPDYFKVMLAVNFDDYKHKIKYPVYYQPKLDGIRCVVEKAGMFSRNGKPFKSAPHIYKNLEELFYIDEIFRFDGELYCNKLKSDFNKIVSLVKRTKPSKEDIIESAATIQYWIYDFPSSNKNFSERFDDLTKLLSTIKRNQIVLVPTYRADNEEQLTKAFELFLEEGYEGQIIRIDAPYENKRSKVLLKRKEFMDHEFQIIDVIEGEGNRTGTAGYFVLKLENGNTFRSNIKGPFDYLKELLKDRKQLIGKLATVKFHNWTPDGVPRFPYVITIRDYE
jgi:DNA ligase-1